MAILRGPARPERPWLVCFALVYFLSWIHSLQSVAVEKSEVDQGFKRVGWSSDCGQQGRLPSSEDARKVKIQR
jgi:hypothetical protein